MCTRRSPRGICVSAGPAPPPARARWTARRRRPNGSPRRRSELAATAKDYRKAIEIYEQVGIASLESNLLKFSVKNYLLAAGLCRLAAGMSCVEAIERYEAMDATQRDDWIKVLIGGM